MRLGGAQCQSGQYWRRKNLLPLTGFESRILKSVASPYTDYATPAQILRVDHKYEENGFLKYIDNYLAVCEVS
jgi:hypothetical protein